VSVVEEGNERIDIGSASSTTADNLVVDNRYRILRIVQASIWADDQRKWQLTLLQQRVVGRDGVECTTKVLARFVCEFGGCSGGVRREVDWWWGVV
jgi:hypothetical protein